MSHLVPIFLPGALIGTGFLIYWLMAYWEVLDWAVYLYGVCVIACWVMVGIGLNR